MSMWLWDTGLGRYVVKRVCGGARSILFEVCMILAPKIAHTLFLAINLVSLDC